jgi:hypothetical protein
MEYCGYRQHVLFVEVPAKPSAILAKHVMAKDWSQRRLSWKSKFRPGSTMVCEFDYLVKDNRAQMEAQREMPIVSSD